MYESIKMMWKFCRFIYAFQSFGVYRVNVLISENPVDVCSELYHYVEITTLLPNHASYKAKEQYLQFSPN
jgi:hypothetical protein